eukprot:m.67630 g.67630  ORF g.67630 m.67630 type:complete len:736 (+) comp12719_c0_seq4:22-2229(+)
MDSKVPTFDADKEKIKRFLQEYQAAKDVPGYGTRQKYLEMMQRVSNRLATLFIVDLEDLELFDEDLADAVRNNTKRYEELFAEVIDEIKMPPTVELTDRSVLDITIHHRQQLAQMAAAQAGEAAPTTPYYPASLQRRFSIAFHTSPSLKPSKIRGIDAQHIGKLVKVRGIVIRATPVKPSLAVATYACEMCNQELYHEIKGPTFMPKMECSSQECATAGRKGRLNLVMRGSRFERFQELRIQEMASDVPPGSIPRAMTVHLRGHQTRSASPGDVVTITGIFLPMPNQGYRAIRIGLLTTTYLDAHLVEQEKIAHADHVLTMAEREEIEERASEPSTYEQLAASLCPHIYGHDDVKKALLLLLVGGVDRSLRDGMTIRGHIHMCLVGDPGVAKSQMLKAICDFAPRAVYTTGRGSSGVGLTAAITKDPLTNELVLEGGALVLADMGVCCIDEFDKMDEGDRTAIHEVMEQQTVSIAKAGITTTLNSRTSVLAAANSVFGRWDDSKDTNENVEFQTTILSRFDLIFVVKDEHDEARDQSLARHVLNVHMRATEAPERVGELTVPFLKKFIEFCRTRCGPRLSAAARDKLASHFVRIREDMKKREDSSRARSAIPITVRQLEALVRIAEALAKMAMQPFVTVAHVDEAIRLFQVSTLAAAAAGTAGDDQAADLDGILKIEMHIKKRFAIGSQLAEARLVADLAEKNFNEAMVRKVVAIMLRRGELEHQKQRRVLYRVR